MTLVTIAHDLPSRMTFHHRAWPPRRSEPDEPHGHRLDRFTWNTNTGCKAVSPACGNCYARTTAENKRGTAAFPAGFDVQYWPERLSKPARRRKPALIFAGSMTDFFQVDIPDWQRDALFEAIEAAPQHTFQILTKRPARAWKYFQRRPVPANVWLGTTIEDTTHVLRADFLRRIDARVRFISAEPLFDALEDLDLTGIQWVIVGGESGSHLWNANVCAARALVERVDKRWVPRADRVEWVRRLRDRCRAAGVAFFFKQWGGPTTKAGGWLLDGRPWQGISRMSRLRPRALEYEKRRRDRAVAQAAGKAITALARAARQDSAEFQLHCRCGRSYTSMLELTACRHGDERARLVTAPVDHAPRDGSRCAHPAHRRRPASCRRWRRPGGRGVNAVSSG